MCIVFATRLAKNSRPQMHETEEVHVTLRIKSIECQHTQFPRSTPVFLNAVGNTSIQCLSHCCSTL